MMFGAMLLAILTVLGGVSTMWYFIGRYHGQRAMARLIQQLAEHCDTPAQLVACVALYMRTMYHEPQSRSRS